MQNYSSKIKINKFLISGVFLFALFGFVHAAQAATYYVATTGSDANPGTISQPFKTIAKGLSVTRAGDTLYIRGGVYNERIDSNNQAIPTGTSWSDAPIIAAYPGESVTLYGTINLAHSYIQYLIFQNIILDATGQDSVYGTAFATNRSTHHVRFQGGEIRNSPRIGVAIGGDASYYEILGVKIHHNQSHGFYISGAYNLIDGNDIYTNGAYDFRGNHHYGVQIYNGDSPSSAHHNTIRNNKIYDHNADPLRGSGGITLSGSDSNVAYNNLVYNNTSSGIEVGPSSTNNLVYNNTVVGNTGDGILIWPGANDTIVRNNILYQNGLAINDIGNRTIKDHNLTTNPSFVNAGANDFHFQSSSLAINAGVTLSEVTTDFDGVTRPQGSGYDIGAYEYVPSTGSGPAAADLNSDSRVNSVDAAILMGAWGQTTKPKADINQDGIVNSVDASMMMGQWSG